jgi:hypothetical protein
VPTFSGTINGKKFAVSGRDNFEKWLKKITRKVFLGLGILYITTKDLDMEMVIIIIGKV